MPIELRPRWCLSDEVVEQVLHLDEWRTLAGGRAFDQDGDAWRPGQALLLKRDFEPVVEADELRHHLGLAVGQGVGIAARWSCGATNLAGVHVDGPAPVEITEPSSLVVGIPEAIGRSVEIETCLVSRWHTGDRPAGACPDGALLWSDGWTLPPRVRSILLEGDELRIPVRTVSFAERYDSRAGALWSIELETTIELDDPLSNVVTVILNRDVLQRDFADTDGEPDPAQIPPALLCGVSVDLVRSLTAALIGDLGEEQDWSDLEDGTVGSVLLLRLTQAFGSVPDGADAFANDQPAFTRRLNDVFAPDSWSMSR